MKRGVLAVALTFAFALSAGAFPVGPSPAVGEARRLSSVTILLDLSYSMRLPLNLNKDDTLAPTRLEEAKHLLDSLLAKSSPATKWSLLTFGGSDEPGGLSPPRVRIGFTNQVGRLRAAINPLSTWGKSPLREALLFAERYTEENSPSGQRILLVVSDGIDTAPSLYDLPASGLMRGSGARLVFAGIASPAAPSLTAGLRRWTNRAGGIYVSASNSGAVAAALASKLSLDGTVRRTAHEPAGAGKQLRAHRGIPAGAGAAATVTARPSVVPLLLTWPFFIGMFLILVPLGLFALQKHRHSKLLARLAAQRRKEHILRFADERQGSSIEVVVAQAPVRLEGGPGRGQGRLLLELQGDMPLLVSAKPILVNGVAVRSRELRRGDRIRSKDAVWVYAGAELRASGPPDPPRPSARFHVLAACAAAAASVALFVTMVLAPAAHVQRSPPPAVTVAAVPQEFVLAGRAGNAAPFTHTHMVSPGAEPAFFKADILFIHAHPDDQSINFGGLMAREARAGKRIVSVVFTDGTAGLDQYPYRVVNGAYPAHRLQGAALARVRVREAESALSILGAQDYVRLGLHNNPYNSLKDILPLSRVLGRWGGRRHVVEELARLIEGFRPEIVVSPDEHHRGVFTHFEHEAVGYVTDQALELLRSRGETFVQAHLISVGPMVRSQYKGVFCVNVLRAAPRSGLSYRAIQVAALKQYVSQRDASVIAIEVVSNFACEYYVARYWRFDVPPTEYFSTPARG